MFLSMIKSFAMVAVAAMTLGSAYVSASPASYGTKIKLEFESTPTPLESWELSIWAMTYFSFEDGLLELQLTPTAARESIEDIKLWKGKAAAHDTFTYVYRLPSPPPGLYTLHAGLVPFPDGKPQGTFGSSSIWYVKVTPDTVFLARSSNRENIRNEILYDARKRGFGAVAREAWDTLAPDLAERWRLLHGRSSIPHIRPAPKPVIIEASDEERSNPCRDTIAIPGSGPPQPRVRPDTLYKNGENRGKRPQRPRPGPPRKPGDSEFGRSEEALKIRELIRQYNDTAQSIPDTGSQPRP